jgi:hypothetical protein
MIAWLGIDEGREGSREKKLRFWMRLKYIEQAEILWAGVRL